MWNSFLFFLKKIFELPNTENHDSKNIQSNSQKLFNFVGHCVFDVACLLLSKERVGCSYMYMYIKSWI